MVSTVLGTPPISQGLFDNSSFDNGIKKEANTVESQSNGISSNNQNGSAKAHAVNSKADENKAVDFTDLKSKLNQALDGQNLSIEFSTDKDTKKVIMKLLDNKTQEVIRQIPPEISIKIAKIVAQDGGLGQVTNAKI